MGVFDLYLGKLRIPLYDLGTLVAGFYIGYNEGNGIDTSATVKYLTKYGPTAFAVISTPLTIKLLNTFRKWMVKGTSKNLQMILQGEPKNKCEELDEDQKEELTSKVYSVINNLESRIENPKYLKHTLTAGARTAIETTVGYIAGRLYSQLN